MKIFVDTGAWMAVTVRNDKHHLQALGVLEKFQRQFVQLFTTDYVLDETLTLVRMRAGHQKAVEIGKSIVDSPLIRTVNIEKQIWGEAWKIFQRYKDKVWSFTDCTSFAVMDLFQIENAFAFDKNFKQYGKKMLP